MSDWRALTPEETTRVPIIFEAAEFNTASNVYYAEVKGKPLTTSRLEDPWSFSDTGEPITVEEFLDLLPGSRLLDNFNPIKCTGTFRGKNVRWSRSKDKFVYKNNHPVDFSITQEEEEVSQVLESATEAVSSTLTQISQTHSTP